MEAFRDLALAYYQNHEDQEYKTALHDYFDKLVEDGTDFSEYFRTYSIPMPRFPDGWLETFELFKKKTMDFEEFITGTYLCLYAEIVILCKGCSSLITGKPYFICVDCFDDLSGGRSFNLCCHCYRFQNFKGHNHRRFLCNHSMLHRGRVDAAVKQGREERRNKFIDGAMMKFGAEFMEFARSVTTDLGWENRFGSILNIDKDEKFDKASPYFSKEIRGENSDEEEKEKENSTMARPQGSRNRYVDILGAAPTENAGIRIRNN